LVPEVESPVEASANERGRFVFEGVRVDDVNDGSDRHFTVLPDSIEQRFDPHNIRFDVAVLESML
jgi:hypothetical protein